MSRIIMKEYWSGDFYYEGVDEGTQPKSVTKALGGDKIVTRTRYLSNKGVGGWVTEWRVKPADLFKVKASAQLAGYGLLVLRYNKELNTYYEDHTV